MSLVLIQDIVKPLTTAPFASIGDRKLQAIRKLTDIFKKNTNPQEFPHKETSQTRVEEKHNNPHKTTTSPRVKIPRYLQTPAPTARKTSKPHIPTPIVEY